MVMMSKIQHCNVKCHHCSGEMVLCKVTIKCSDIKIGHCGTRVQHYKHHDTEKLEWNTVKEEL